MDSKRALEILFKDIHSMQDLRKDENRWIKHCLYVGQAAGRIARRLNLDEDYARSVGFMHDIGRRIDQSNHVVEGYKYLIKLGYPDIARYTITHSFVDNVISNTAGGGPKSEESYDYIESHLDNYELNIYDNIVQLCDLFCLDTGYTTFEKRILDVTKRKGVYPNSMDHFISVMMLKNRIESMIGISIYELFPEIKKEDLDSVEDDYSELMELFKTKGK